jgi:uncharacterized protein YcfL
MKILILLLAAIIIFTAGCQQQGDPRMHARNEVGSDSLASNIVTRPIQKALDAITGRGIVVSNAVTKRNDVGLLEVQINGYNQSMDTKRFRYMFKWFDETGGLIETKTSVWLPMSVMGNQPFSVKGVAPRPEAVNFRMDNRKWAD